MPTTTPPSPKALEKRKRAAAHPDRPGEGCHGAAQAWRPVVDFRRCEGKGDCEEVCPHGVFALEQLRSDDRAGLPLIARFKIAVHGGKVAYTPGADACHACGLCVVACPEGAIRLERRG